MTSAPLILPTDSPGDSRIAPRPPAAGDFSALQVTIIEPQKGWRPIDFQEVWRYRELLYFLTWRDIKVQYKQTVLGPAWALFRPVFNLVIFSVVFGKFANFPSEGVPYPIFVFAGMLPWMFFANAVNHASTSLLNHVGILSKVYFPRILLPVAGMGSGLVTFGINLFIYACLMAWYGQLPGISVLLLPGLVLLTAMTALGIGYFLAGLIVVYRDLAFIVSSIVQALMYLTPVIYPVTVVPEEYRWILKLNPMVGIISAFRSVLLNRPVDYGSLGVSLGCAVLLLVMGLYCFGRTERRLADTA